MAEEQPYNPLDYDKLTENLVRELMSRKPHELPLSATFDGPGVYALFYRGGFPLYDFERSPDASRPIYVGKAIPEGARKGMAKKGAGAPSLTLLKRLKEHERSITQAENLDIKDFQCRYLIVIPLWITMAERFLLEHYQPIWNVCIEGFGLHDPGKGRHQGKLSWWDALHPGRPWAKSLLQTRTGEDAERRLVEFRRSGKWVRQEADEDLPQ